jgi:CheY-like chemotaxis protein
MAKILADRSPSDRAMIDGFLIKPVTASMLQGAIVDALADPTPRKSPELKVTGQRLAGMRLLVVEDNLVNQQVARELLQQECAVVQTANDRLDAITQMAAEQQEFQDVGMDQHVAKPFELNHRVQVLRHQAGWQDKLKPA